MLSKRHIGCLFTITPHPYGSVTLRCGDEVFDMTYNDLHVTLFGLDITLRGENEIITHHFIALGNSDDWVYSCVITGGERGETDA